MIQKEIPVKYPVNGNIQNRWSPRAFDAKTPNDEDLRSMFEAARRAPSAFNDQPWSFIFAFKGTSEYNAIMESLVAFNQQWAITAPVLIVAMGSNRSSDGKRENTTWQYDTGQAVALLTIQGMEKGIYTHQMGGFNSQYICEYFKLPEHISPITVIAAGYPGDIGQIPASMREQEKEIKSRKEFDTFVFSHPYGSPNGLFKHSS